MRNTFNTKFKEKVNRMKEEELKKILKICFPTLDTTELTLKECRERVISIPTEEEEEWIPKSEEPIAGDPSKVNAIWDEESIKKTGEKLMKLIHESLYNVFGDEKGVVHVFLNCPYRQDLIHYRNRKTKQLEHQCHRQ